MVRPDPRPHVAIWLEPAHSLEDRGLPFSLVASPWPGVEQWRRAVHEPSGIITEGVHLLKGMRVMVSMSLLKGVRMILLGGVRVTAGVHRLKGMYVMVGIMGTTYMYKEAALGSAPRAWDHL